MAVYQRTPEQPLTEKEREVVTLLSQGKTGPEIEEILGVTIRTIERRLDRAWIATGTRNRCGLVGLALRRGWIE